MKQVAQRPRNGAISLERVPAPSLDEGSVLVDTQFSLLSAGTERAKLETGRKSLAGKARARPDLVRKVVDKARAEGVSSAVTVVRDRLDSLAPLGYSASGTARAVGRQVVGVSPGDRVACAGAGWANHAGVIAVPQHLVARVPDRVDLADAAYTTVGAIALHAVRQAEARLGERIGVIGLGLVGQLAIRIATAGACTVIGIDPDEVAVRLASDGGAQAFNRNDSALEAKIASASGGLGLDAVLVTAAASSNDPVELAAALARDRGRIVIVGDVPVAADRAVLYEKELEVVMSRSYGPGRYDRDYEERGRDLPAGYVRWTVQRNMEAFLRLVADGRLAPADLTTHRFALERADEAYALLGARAGERPFGILLEYGIVEEATPPERPTTRSPARKTARIGVIGAGSFARATLLPELKRAEATLAAVTTQSGLSAANVATRFGFERAAESAEEILGDESIDAVVIATPHSSHADLTVAALEAGKAVFVEKPLALDEDEEIEVEQALSSDSVLMVGFNRRFAPLTARLKEEFAGVTDLVVSVRVNAGPLPAEHWLHDPEIGGGRLLGEGCHFVDFLAHVTGAVPVWVSAAAVGQAGRPIACSDSLAATVRLEPDAVATLSYSGGGDSRLAKERIEMFGGGASAVLDDFRRLEIYRRGRRKVLRGAQDKGHRAELRHFIDAVTGRAEAPAPASYFNSTRATLAAARSLRTGEAVPL